MPTISPMLLACAALIVCFLSCKKTDDTKTGTVPPQTKVCTLQSIVATANHKDSQSNSSYIYYGRLDITFAQGRITSYSAPDVVNFVFDSNKIYVNRSSYSHDTLFVDKDLRILERRKRDDKTPGCDDDTIRTMHKYDYDAAGLLTRFIYSQVVGPGKPTGNTILYTFANGDLVSQIEQGSIKTEYEYYQKLVPAGFLTYGQIKDAGSAFTYRNVHLLKSAVTPIHGWSTVYNYLFDSDGKIIQMVTTMTYHGHVMTETDDYYYTCQ